MYRSVVKSSNIVSVGYDPKTKTLEVEFKNGGVYGYANVPPALAELFLKSKSLGKFFSANILNKFSTTKIG